MHAFRARGGGAGGRDRNGRREDGTKEGSGLERSHLGMESMLYGRRE